MKCKGSYDTNPITCPHSVTVQVAALIMSEEDVGIVPVVDAQTNRLVGVVTDRDLCLDVAAAGCNPKETKIANSLHTHPVICFADDDIEECLEQMKVHQVRRVPIVDEDGRCVGIIPQKDLALVLNEPQKLIETIKEISSVRNSFERDA